MPAAGCPGPRAGCRTNGPQKAHRPNKLVDLINLIELVDLIDLIDPSRTLVDLTDLIEQLQREFTKEQKDSDWG